MTGSFFDFLETITPRPCDFEQVASDIHPVTRDTIARIVATKRMYDNGELPVELMRAFEGALAELDMGA